MVGGDEPELQVQVVVPLLHADEVEDVVVLHAAHAVDLVLVLPRQLVLDESRQTWQGGNVALKSGQKDVFVRCVCPGSSRMCLIPGWGRSLRPRIRSAAGPSTRIQSAPWPSPQSAAAVCVPGWGMGVRVRDPVEGGQRRNIKIAAAHTEGD